MPKIARSVTIEYDVWSRAKRLGINISEGCERGLALLGEIHIDVDVAAGGLVDERLGFSWH